MASVGKIARRTLLVGAVAVTGGVAFGYWRYKSPYPNPLKAGLADGEAAITPYVMVKADGVTIITPRGEMGQGVQTTLAALVAEELDMDWNDVKIEHGPPSKAYYNAAVMEEALPISSLDDSGGANFARGAVHVVGKFMALQITGGSSAAADAYEKMRVAGAAAREVLKKAAAKKLNVKASVLTTEGGKVISPDGQRIPYADLASIAATISTPSNVTLRSKDQWRILGKPTPRLDMNAKCTGTATFGLDVRLPGMKFATVKMNPHLGAPMNGYDATRALAVKGVERVMDIGGGVVVVANNTWTAFKAADLIEFDWAAAEYPSSTGDHFAMVDAAFAEETLDSRHRDDGDVVAALAEGDVVEAAYTAPYLAHAAMEPVNALAQYKDGVLDIWTGTQAPLEVQMLAAQTVGLKQDNVRVHTQFMGGGFGRKGEVDFTNYAAKAAMQMEGTPVLVTWSREEDMRHDMYRPLALSRFKGAVKDGVPVAIDFEVACPSVLASGALRGGPNLPGGDITSAQTIWDQPYAVEHYRATAYRAPNLLPVGSWRSVGASQNAFFHESMMDELAHAAGRDPMEMRLDLMNNDVCRAVLEAAAELSNWGGALPAGHARGCAFCLSFGVPTAEVIEVADTPEGIKIVNAFAAVDVGIALDPQNIDAQIISGLNFGLSAAIMGEITVADGAVVQSNFHDFDAIRMHQAPAVKTKILENGASIHGIGEPATPPAAPALANAIFAATGDRIREMPFHKHAKFI